MTSSLAPAPGVVVLDMSGNVLWGQIPAIVPVVPPVAQNTSLPQLLHWTSDGLSVSITASGSYTLEVVNAAGLWIQTLFSGSWGVGTQVVSAKASSYPTGSYIVLLHGSTVLAQLAVGN